MNTNHTFSLAPSINCPRSTFKRPFQLKTTIDTDYLYPVYCDEILPADTVKMRFSFFGRLSTPLVPIMDRLFLDVFFFFVPNRLVDKDWKKLQGERPFGDLSVPVTAPKLNTGETGVAVGSLSDYLGIPVNVPNLDFLPYWHRGYNLIWNEWFRPQYICPAVKVAGLAEDGTQSEESLDDYVLLKRAKRLDYFTGANPFPQVGEAVTIPLGTSAPVRGNGVVLGLTDGLNDYGLQSVSGNAALNVSAAKYGGDAGDDAGTPAFLAVALGVTDDSSKSGLVADLSNASAITINALRNAFASQHYLEALARSGSRYQEILRGIFNTVCPDGRLQRPEYLGGCSVPLDITTVPQTSASESGGTPQGNLAAFGTVSAQGSWSHSFCEHGIILGLVNVRADLSYQQGLNRMFSRSTRFDWYLPQFANVGEQAILNKELFAQGNSVVDAHNKIIDNDVFGYQEAWAEYRYHPHMITGKFRSGISGGSLDYWHLAQEFESLPELSPDFVLEEVPISRCLAVNDEPAIILGGAFDSLWSRAMPLYSVPGLSRL